MNISQYYAEICKQPILSAEEEKHLLDVYFDEWAPQSLKDNARNTLIASNMRFVFKRAKALSKGDIDQFSELIAAGNEGLIVGLDKFDHSKGMRFLTYAGWWIYQRQMKSMNDFRLVSLPTQKQQLSVKIKKYKEELGYTPTMKQLEEEFPDANKKDLHELNQTAFLTFYLDCVNEDEIPTFEGLAEVDYGLLLDKLEEAIDAFGEDADLVRKLYGTTMEGRRLSYSEIIQDHPGVSRQYLKDLKERALDVLKERLGG